MPTITIKNIPEAIHGALKTRATEHGRSLNKEVLRCLEAAVSVSRVEVESVLVSVDRVRDDGVRLDPALLNAAMSDGRP
ncbi:MAG TPA: Arc family DNA-binding protein [Verrucomicrobiales bacterium]|nr:Arc family DNA-binding protein [Verrucomicrobiales bacterium]